ncbi:MAG: cytochrome c [Alphaproteobacteria bacterium]|nr:MAG: cytochrome c [Alphaproteobacteria bacterium]
MSRLRSTILGLGAGALVAGAVALSAQAQGSDNPAVTARQSLMRLYAFNIGTLGAMAKGNMPYDAEAAAAAARNLAALSHLNGKAMWPAGTDNASIEGTHALPAIWEDFAGFAAKGQALQAATEAMAEAAPKGLESLQGAMGPLGAACGGCHKVYRASMK